jgi:hypothetical protein
MLPDNKSPTNVSGSAGTAPPAYDDTTNSQPVADGRTPSDLPAEDEVDTVDVTAAFAKLNLSSGGKDPDADTCLAHLKLLFAIQSMKEDTGYTDGLWNLWDSRADGADRAYDLADGAATGPGAQHGDKGDQDQKRHVLSRLREKRWALFVARAVDRYEAWWAALAANGGLTEHQMASPTSAEYIQFPTRRDLVLEWDEKMLPPLGTPVLANSGTHASAY